jgi:hypothetical protein
MISSPLTLTETTPVVESTVQHAEPYTVRKHPANGHDPIGRRFSEATQSPMSSRGCTCRPA